MGKTQRIVGAVLVVLALVLAGYAWILSQRITAQRQETLTQMQPVVVAATRISAGSAIAPGMVRIAMCPTRPEGAYADLKAVDGKVTPSDIAAGEPLLQERLESTMRPMLQNLEPGERAVAVRVDDVVAVGNRLNPGDLVDVYVTLRRNQEEIPDTQSRRLLEKLKVLAFGSKDLASGKTSNDNAGGSMRTNPEAPKTAVLAVKVEDVDKLALAADNGRLLLALRPHEPPQPTQVSPAGGNAAESGKAPVVAAAQVPPSPPEIMTLRELTNRRAESLVIAGTAALAANRTSGVRPVGKAVTVMHGLKEKTVYVSTKRKEARP